MKTHVSSSLALCESPLESGRLWDSNEIFQSRVLIRSGGKAAPASQSEDPFVVSHTSTLKEHQSLARPERRHVTLSCGKITTQREREKERES